MKYDEIKRLFLDRKLNNLEATRELERLGFERQDARELPHFWVINRWSQRQKHTQTGGRTCRQKQTAP